MRQTEDFAVHKIFSFVPEAGAPLLSATYARSFVDLNREPYELDASMYKEPLPPYASNNSHRVMSGLGTLHRRVGTQNIYKGLLSTTQAIKRIESYYKPFHQTLHGLIHEAIARFGFVFLIDCHSMPSEQKVSPLQDLDNKPLADIVLGNNYRRSCSLEFTSFMERFFRREQYTLAENKPYAGGFITSYYGNPKSHIHSLQIEINRTLYMHEAQVKLHKGQKKVQATMKRMVASLTQKAHHDMGTFSHAAQ